MGGRAELCNGGPRSCQEGKRGCNGPHDSSQGLGLVLPLTAHATFRVPQSTEHCFPWFQVRRAVREASPITLANIMREEGFPLEKYDQGRAAQGGHGCCLPNSGLCQTHRTPQCKERRLEGHHVVLEYQSVSDRKAGPSGMVSGLHVGGLCSGAINFQATRSPALGQAEKMKTTRQAEFPPQLYALQVVLTLTHVML